jgi:TolB-like protein
LYRNGVALHLEPRVLRLLIYLIENRDRLVPREELADNVWGDTVISDSALSQAVARLRKALGDSTASPRYIETAHSQGYRFAAEVQASGSQIHSIAVLPIRNLTGDSGQDYMAYGLQDGLTTELSRISDLRVTSFQSTLRYSGSDRALPEIALELGVDALVEGSLMKIGEQIEVNLQLIDGRTDEHIWAQHFEREIPYSFDLLTNAVNAIASKIGLHGVHESIGPVDPNAIQAYWLGLNDMNRLSPTGLASAINYLRTATEIEPRFDLAWGNLAVTHFLQALFGFTPPRESMEKAQLAAQHAVRVGNRSSFGLSVLGWTYLCNQDFPGACKTTREALRINPSDPYAIHGDADCLLYEGHMEESVERVRELALIAPFSFIHQVPLSYHLFLARRYDEALAFTLSIQERFPNFPLHKNLSLIYWQQGLYDKALQEERRKYELYGDTELLTLFDESEAATAPRELMRAIAEALVERSATSYVDAIEIGEAFAKAGAVDEAIYWLTRAVEQKSFTVVHLPFRPDFDGLRGDPRFTGLLQKLGYQAARVTD